MKLNLKKKNLKPVFSLYRLPVLKTTRRFQALGSKKPGAALLGVKRVNLTGTPTTGAPVHSLAAAAVAAARGDPPAA
jgi:hypothetical protein